MIYQRCSSPVARPARLMLALSLVASLLGAPAVAQGKSPAWSGVWQGTVGSLPIRACLARRSELLSVGAYFYASKLQAIRLEQQGNSRLWLEGEGSTGRAGWTFEQVGAQALAGTWSGNGRRLPFRLTRVAGLAAGTEPCGSLLFNAPRLQPLRIVATRATIGGVAYTKLRGDPGRAFEEVGLETFALDGNDPATRRINAALRKPLAGAPARSGWFECMASELDAHGRDGDYATTITPTTITARWVAANDSTSLYCGGPHPSYNDSSLIFDRTTGASVELSTWLNEAAVSRTRSGGEVTALMRPAMRRVIIARWRDAEAECREAASTEEYWDIGLARTGLSFTPSMPHVLTPCKEATVVPWAALTPFLSAAGKAGATTLR